MGHPAEAQLTGDEMTSGDKVAGGTSTSRTSDLPSSDRLVSDLTNGCSHTTSSSSATTVLTGSPTERFATAMTLVPELSEVEEIIKYSFRSDVRLMNEIPGYLLALGGKRIRPVLALLCGRALGLVGTVQPLLDVAAGIELIHMATLLHDDIIDHSPIRRHQPSPLARYGVASTLLSGDFLLTRAFGLCARLDKTIIEATEQACIALVEGESLETLLCDEQHSIDSCHTIAQRKTASLFKLSAFCAAHIAQVPDETAKAMSEFGEQLGIAFQYIDDILDVTSNEATLGKQTGLDIIERKPSLVNVLWLQSSDPAADRLRTAVPQTPELRQREEAEVASLLPELASGPIINEAKRLARERAQAAAHALDTAARSTPRSNPSYLQALHSVIDFAVERLR